MSKRRLSLLALVSMLAGLLILPAGTARAQTTYEVLVGQDFFNMGVPGFSGRFYPGSMKVHQGDTLHFDFPIGMTQIGEYPQELMGAHDAQIGEEGTALASQPLLFDPDDGPDALKGNLGSFLFGGGDDCGAQDNPCSWGPNTDPIFPAFTDEEAGVFVTVDAPPGTTLWGASFSSPDVNVNLKVEVVNNAEAASTQEELDQKAARLLEKDAEDAAALHNKMSAKKTWHLNAQGKRVFDVFVGASAGPIELLASYPRRTAIRQRQRVQFHFMDQMEPHTATFGGSNARDVLQNFFIGACDPDGDEGAGPDVDPIDFDPETGLPVCPEGTELEADVHELAPWAVGNGRVNGNSDYENSGLQFPHFPDGSDFDVNPDPWTLGFPKASTKKGFKFICLIHGGFMGGRVRVR